MLQRQKSCTLIVIQVKCLYLTSPIFNSSAKSNRLFLLQRRKYNVPILIEFSEVINVVDKKGEILLLSSSTTTYYALERKVCFKLYYTQCFLKEVYEECWYILYTHICHTIRT